MTNLVLKRIKKFEELYKSGRTILNRREIEDYIGHVRLMDQMRLA